MLSQRNTQSSDSSENNTTNPPSNLNTFQTYLRWLNDEYDPRANNANKNSATRMSELQGALDNVYLWALILNKESCEEGKPLVAPVHDVARLIRIYAQLGTLDSMIGMFFMTGEC